MERTIAQQLATIEAAYAAVCWRRERLAEGIVTLGDFRTWLAKQPQEMRQYYETENQQARVFLGKRPIKDAEDIRNEKIRALLWTEAVFLYAVECIEKQQLPEQPMLREFVGWIGTFKSSSPPII